MSETKYTVVMTADWNDGDYLTEEHTVSKKELCFLIKVSKIIRSKGGEFPAGDSQVLGNLYKELTTDDLDNFRCYLPYPHDGDNIHTFIEMKYTPEIEWSTI